MQGTLITKTHAVTGPRVIIRPEQVTVHKYPSDTDIPAPSLELAAIDALTIGADWPDAIKAGTRYFVRDAQVPMNAISAAYYFGIRSYVEIPYLSFERRKKDGSIGSYLLLKELE